MKIYIFIFISLQYLVSYGQKELTENFINQISEHEIAPNYKYYYLKQQSFSADSTHTYFSKNNQKGYKALKNILLKIDTKIPIDLVYSKNDSIINWNNYNITKVKFTEKINPSYRKKVYLINSVDSKTLDSLNLNKKPQTLYIKKKWYWSKSKKWKEVEKAWEFDEKTNIEDQTFYSFSTPIFSSDTNYAKISILKMRKFEGTSSTIIFRLKNEIWEKVYQYNESIIKYTPTDIYTNSMYAIFEKYKIH